ncbi:SDR family NAD(P)-dependent oxidoreductase [Phocaeicola abscessus]|uniref:SDR family NAD(P)-dependent oxidoreductase n=1 Tax=Phocaeicola abscessus TaxID=555313 RepID=UPI000385B65E|nr:SDR family NAD(P)-dependent oxidoreductase [Phocaeicola abscessus]EPT34347.1 oxidoreductase, short chain dehydrogenase/reductase family protein [Bacteroidetes bacterium oral taxon 272 str. F0290]
MKRAIIIGASSGIGMEVGKLLLADGWMLGLAARRTDRLMELQTLNPERIRFERIDVTEEDAPEKLRCLIDKVGGMDLFFYASGIGKRNPELDKDIELDTVNTNALGFTRMVNAAFHYLVEQGGGQIAVISSVAGTKGLGAVPSYSATKAFQNCYIEALEQLVHSRKLNIRFTDIRPGFVATPLLNDARKYPMLMQVQAVSKQIVKAIYKRKHVRVIDFRWRMFTFFWKIIPHRIWRKLKI